MQERCFFDIFVCRITYFMYERKLYSQLVEHLSRRHITVITGMRRVGKTTALRFLLNKIKHENKVFIDLEKIENRYIFSLNSYKEIQIELEILGIDFSKPAVIVLDEVQLLPEITSIIKYFYDHFDIKFLISGSSSFYIKGRFSESLAGRKRIFEMYPLSFSEFVRFKQKDPKLLEKYRLGSYRSGIYLEFKELYEEFIRFGGFPEVVLAETEDDKIAYLKDVINAHIELDIKLLSDFEESHNLYRLILLLAPRVASPLEPTKLSSILGINRNKIRQYLQLLEKTYFILPISPFSSNVDREIRKRKKLYFSDTGILNVLAKVSSGQLFENAIAVQLNQLGEVHYFQKSTGQEIDFILNREIALEVKETPAIQDLNKLTSRVKSLHMSSHHLIGRYLPASKFSDFVWGGCIV